MKLDFYNFIDNQKKSFSNHLQSSFFRNVLKISFGTLIGQMLIILVSPILSRQYSPEDFGIKGLLVSFTGFFVIAASLGLELSIVSAIDKLHASRIIIICFVFNVILSIFSSYLLKIFITFDFLSYGILPDWAIVPSGFIIFATALFMALRYYSLHIANFKAISEAMIFQGIGRSASPVLLGLFIDSWLGLVLGDLFGRFFGIQRLFRIAYKDLKIVIKQSKIKDFFDSMIINWKFVIFGLPSSLINSLYTLLPVPFILDVYGPDISGQFLFVTNILSLPTSLISGSVADAFHSKLSEIKNNSPDLSRKFLLKTVRNLSIFALLIFIPIILFSPILFPIIFGSQWNIAGKIMSYKAILSIFTFIISPITRAILVYEKQEHKLVIDLFRLALPFISIYAINYFGFSFFVSLLTYVVLGVVVYIYYLFIVYRLVK